MGEKLFKYFASKYQILLLFKGTAKVLWALCFQVGQFLQGLTQRTPQQHMNLLVKAGAWNEGTWIQDLVLPHSRCLTQASHFLIYRMQITITSV